MIIYTRMVLFSVLIRGGSSLAWLIYNQHLLLREKKKKLDRYMQVPRDPRRSIHVLIVRRRKEIRLEAAADEIREQTS